MSNRFLAIHASVALGALASMALSLPLWQTRTTYPRVPLFDAIPAFPHPLDTAFCLAFAAAFGILAWRPKLKRLATLL